MAPEDYATNANDETGRYRMLLLNQAEHDDPEQAPSYCGEKLVLVGGVYLTQETAEELCRSEAA